MSVRLRLPRRPMLATAEALGFPIWFAGLGMLCISPRHARSSPKRDELLANFVRRVPSGTAKRIGEQIARFGPYPAGGVVLRAIRFVSSLGPGHQPGPRDAPHGSSRKSPAAHGA